MRRPTLLLAVGAVVAVASIVGADVLISGPHATTIAKQEPAVSTAKVERGDLSQVIAASGALTYRARPDGSPYVAINHATGTYTQLPEAGDAVACGDVFYRVDDKPVLLLCGGIPSYRVLSSGATGADVAQLNRNLHTLGYDKAVGVQLPPDGGAFTWKTQKALCRLQHDRGQEVTGRLSVPDVVVMPTAIRVLRVAAQLGGSARPGTPVAQATSNSRVVQVSLDPSQRSNVTKDSPVLITLPGSRSATGKVAEIGPVATLPDGKGGVEDATILVTITLDNPDQANGLDRAPVRTQITTTGVKDALSVPVVALVGMTGGGYGVDVLRDDGHRQLVAVTLGQFDDTSGRVQVEGDVKPGDTVVVPS